MERLQQIFSQEAEKCILCGSCQAVCPVYAETMDESLVARGRIALIKSVLSGGLGLTDRLSQILSTCIGCKACAENCPSGAAADLANLAAKLTLGQEKGLPFYRKIISRQIFPNPGVLSFSAQLLDIMRRRIYHPLSEIRVMHSALPYVRAGMARKLPPLGETLFQHRLYQNPVAQPSRGRVGLFPGCAVDFFYPHWGESAVRVLNAAGFDVVVPENLTCCGAPVMFMGDFKSAKQVIRKNLSVFSELNVDAVVTLCATCGATLRDLYPSLWHGDEARSLADKVKDLQEFIMSADLLKGLQPDTVPGSTLRVTYHDPCHLKRGMGIHSAPREILQGLAGVDLVEMKDASRCCGGGGLFSLSHYDLALKIGRHKVERIRETGADMVATACPSCAIQLKDLLNREGVNIDVVHVCELADRALVQRATKGFS